MSEYPWDMENMILAQHEQPCDCAVCDEIHFDRETRRNNRKRNSSINEVWMQCTGANYPAHAEAIISGLRRKLEASEKALTQCLSDIEGYKMRIDNLMENFNSDQETIHYFMQEIAAQKAKCNIYNCMDRKDLKLRIQQLEAILAAERKNVLYAQNKWSKHTVALEQIANTPDDYEMDYCRTIAIEALEI